MFFGVDGDKRCEISGSCYLSEIIENCGINAHKCTFGILIEIAGFGLSEVDEMPINYHKFEECFEVFDDEFNAVSTFKRIREYPKNLEIVLASKKLYNTDGTIGFQQFV